MRKKTDSNELNKVLKTVRGSIKKAIFYLGAKVPYAYSLLLITPLVDGLDEIRKRHPDIYNLIELDSQIRKVDDILDEKLYRRIPPPLVEIKREITNFKKTNSDFGDIARLFELELELHIDAGDDLKNKIREIVRIWPSDYFLIIDKIVNVFGSDLAGSDLKNSRLFLEEFQRLRDLLDDIMTTEEDAIKNSYNNIIVAEKNGINYRFIESIIREQFGNLGKSLAKIRRHPNEALLKHTISFWKKQYDILFRPLLVDYYVDKGEYRKIYFMFKQV